MICFPDVNDWHEAFEWETLIFYRVTQMGFLRLLTNRNVMGDPSQERGRRMGSNRSTSPEPADSFCIGTALAS